MIWLTICINASKKILLQSHSIKSIINLIIRCEEILSITSKSAPINSYQIIRKFELNHQKLLKPNSTKIVQLIINITNKTSTNRIRKIKANVNLQIIHSSIKLTGIKLGSFSQTSHDWGKFKKKNCNYLQWVPSDKNNSNHTEIQNEKSMHQNCMETKLQPSAKVI